MGLVMSRPKYVADPQHILGCADAHIVGIIQITWFAVVNELQHLFRRVRVKTYRARILRVDILHRRWHRDVSALLGELKLTGKPLNSPFELARITGLRLE